MSEPASQDIRQRENAEALRHLPEAQGDAIAWLKSVGALRSQCSSPLACAAHDCPVPCEACSAEGEVEVVCTACRHVFPAVPVSVEDRACASEAEFVRTRHIAFFSEARALISKKGANPGEARAAGPKAFQEGPSADAVRNVAKALGRALTRMALRIRAQEIVDRRRKEERRMAERKRAEERKRLEEERRRADAAAAAMAAAKKRREQTNRTLFIVGVLLATAGYLMIGRSGGNRSERLPAETMAEAPTQAAAERGPRSAEPAGGDDRINASEPAPALETPLGNAVEQPTVEDPAPSSAAETRLGKTITSDIPDGAVTEAEGPEDGLAPAARLPTLPGSSAWLGVALSNLDDAAAQARGLPGAMGALVDDVVSGSPAEAAGLRRGDVLLVINGELIDAVSDVLRELRQLQPGMTIQFRVKRDRKDVSTSITLGRAPAP